jgi:hypothetical protein
VQGADPVERQGLQAGVREARQDLQAGLQDSEQKRQGSVQGSHESDATDLLAVGRVPALISSRDDGIR